VGFGNRGERGMTYDVGDMRADFTSASSFRDSANVERAFEKRGFEGVCCTL
jgi:hypothetical protein